MKSKIKIVTVLLAVTLLTVGCDKSALILYEHTHRESKVIYEEGSFFEDVLTGTTYDINNESTGGDIDGR